MINQQLKQKFINTLKQGKAFILRPCSMCDYPTNFFVKKEALFFDAGCDCTTRQEVRLCDWNDLDFYLEPEHGHIPKIEAYIKQHEVPTNT